MTSRRFRIVRRAALGLLCLGLVACSSTAAAELHTGSGVGAGLARVGELPTPASAWPQAGHDARHSGTSSATGPQTAHVKWRRDLGGDATPGPVIGTDGGILAATNAGVLHDLNPSTGRDTWTFDGGGSYGSDLSTSPAVLGGGTILWPGPDNTLFALSAAGKLLWRQHFGGQVLSPAIAGRNRVYVADLAGHLDALEISPTATRPAAHRLVWTLALGGTDYASPTVGPDGTIYTASDHDLVAVRDLGASGAVRWRLRATAMVEVSNGIAPDGTVVLGTNGDHEYGVAPSGKIVWKLDIGDYTYSSSVVSPDGLAYFGDNTGRLHVLDTSDGHVRATVTPQGDGREKIWTSAAVDHVGDYYWATTAGHVYGYNSSGKQLWTLSTGTGINSYPALGGDGTLYVGTTGGTFYAIGG